MTEFGIKDPIAQHFIDELTTHGIKLKHEGHSNEEVERVLTGKLREAQAKGSLENPALTSPGESPI